MGKGHKPVVTRISGFLMCIFTAAHATVLSSSRGATSAPVATSFVTRQKEAQEGSCHQHPASGHLKLLQILLQPDVSHNNPPCRTHLSSSLCLSHLHQYPFTPVCPPVCQPPVSRCVWVWGYSGCVDMFGQPRISRQSASGAGFPKTWKRNATLLPLANAAFLMGDEVRDSPGCCLWRLCTQRLITLLWHLEHTHTHTRRHLRSKPKHFGHLHTHTDGYFFPSKSILAVWSFHILSTYKRKLL